MKSLRSNTRFPRIATLVAVATLAFSTACSSDTLLAPDVAPQQGRIGDLLGGATGLLMPAKALTRDVAIAPMTRSFTFDKNGGKIEIREAGLRIDIPSGAIPGNTLTITVHVLPGKAVAYDFQPHGTNFRKPLQFRQDLAGTSWDDSRFKGALMGGYFKDKSQLNLLTGIALVDELLPIVIKSHEARFDIRHFSGYMVSSGRSSASSEEAF
jgi:ZU5 domain